MSQIDKLIERICNIPSDLRIEEIDKVLKHFGYKMITPNGSSHYKFVKDGCSTIVIPKHGKIDKTYVRLVRDVIEEEKKNEKR